MEPRPEDTLGKIRSLIDDGERGLNHGFARPGIIEVPGRQLQEAG